MSGPPLCSCPVECRKRGPKPRSSRRPSPRRCSRGWPAGARSIGVLRQVGEDRDVVARLTEAEQRASAPSTVTGASPSAAGRPVTADARLADDRHRLRQRRAARNASSSSRGGVLALLDVRLVERVDPEHDPRGGGRHLPAHELGADVERVRELDPLDRVAEASSAPLGRSSLAGQPARLVQRRSDEAAVVAVALGVTDRLADDRHDALPGLAGALGDELLGPVAEAGQTRRGEDGELVAAGQRGLADERAERRPGLPAAAARQASAMRRPARAAPPRSTPWSAAGTRPKTDSAE